MVWRKIVFKIVKAQGILLTVDSSSISSSRTTLKLNLFNSYYWIIDQHSRLDYQTFWQRGLRIFFIDCECQICWIQSCSLLLFLLGSGIWDLRSGWLRNDFFNNYLKEFLTGNAHRCYFQDEQLNSLSKMDVWTWLAYYHLTLTLTSLQWGGRPAEPNAFSTSVFW